MHFLKLKSTLRSNHCYREENYSAGRISRIGAAFAACLCITSANVSAGLLTVDSYTTLNGESDSGNTYHDESYNGVGNQAVDKDPLSGGTGDLTDGYIAANSWAAEELGVANGPYVGWLDLNPTISFFFADLVKITRVILHADNSRDSSGVSAPRAVRFNAGPEISTNATPVQNTVAAYAFDVNFTSTTLDLQIFDYESGGGAPFFQGRQSPSWLMISEIQFEGEVVNPTNQVPLPGTIALLGMGLLVATSRRKLARS
ncbi:MAG: PEP-CTERM sorting domain-containing protein [Pseudomonadota bacterium]